jgi:hypothetical protein
MSVGAVGSRAFGFPSLVLRPMRFRSCAPLANRPWQSLGSCWCLKHAWNTSGTICDETNFGEPPPFDPPILARSWPDPGMPLFPLMSESPIMFDASGVCNRLRPKSNREVLPLLHIISDASLSAAPGDLVRWHRNTGVVLPSWPPTLSTCLPVSSALLPHFQ